MGKEKKVAIGGILSACVLLMSVMLPHFAFAENDSAGVIGQTVGNSRLEMQVTEMNISDNSGQKLVSLSIIFKNLDFAPQLFNMFYMKMKDTDGHEYTLSLFDSMYTSVPVPTRDVVKTVAVFKTPSNAFPKTFYYNDVLRQGLTVDLSKSKTPHDPIPQSEWVLSSNKGFTAKDAKMEITVNDEKISGDEYILDVTIRNIGKESVSYNPFYAYIKDESGKASSNSIFSDINTPLSSGDLVANDFVRGTLAFKMDSTGPVMFIWNGNLGFGSYFNSGELKSSTSSTSTNTSTEHPQVANPVSLSGISVRDFGDNEMVEIHPEASLLLTTTASNQKSVAQPFVAIFEVRDADGNTVSMQFLKGKLSANDSFDLGASWSAEKAGTYTARAFVVTDLKNPQPLSELVQKTLVVR